MKKRIKTTKKDNGKMMSALSKLSKSFMLPISLLPIAGLLLGVGTTLSTTTTGFSQTIGFTMKNIGDVAFNNLAALFAISIAIAYTEDAGVAGLTAFVAWLVFNGVIASFMREGTSHYIVNITFQLSDHPNSYDPSIPGMTNNIVENYQFNMNNNGYLPPLNDLEPGSPWSQQVGVLDSLCRQLNVTFNTNIKTTDIANFKINSIDKVIDNYNLWFWKGDQIGVSTKLVTNILGLSNTLNTGVFAAIFVGLVVAFSYNKFHKIQLPQVVSFFGGVRFVPIITIVFMIPMACLFIILWPALGTSLNWVGENSGKIPYGLDSFIFGVVKRSLVPFGLHHAFYAPLWWTGAGGSLSDFIDPSQVGNANTINATGDQSIILSVIGDSKLKLQDVSNAGLHLGRFMSGEFPIMMFGLPCAAMGMWQALPKDSRKQTIGIYASVAFTSLLTGITEPLEFTFLFVAPWLYYGINVPLFASSYMLANVLNVHVGMTFSGGLLDYILFGIIPVFNGNETGWYWILILGLIYGAIYFAIFYFITKYTNIQLPGKGEIIKFATKDDFRNKKNKLNNVSEEMENLSTKIIEILGGKENIITVDACATRLRINVVESSEIDANKFKEIGAVAATIRGNYIQAIFGGKSDVIKTYIKEKIKGEQNYA